VLMHLKIPETRNFKFEKSLDQMSIFPRETVTWGTLAELNFYRRWNHGILKTGQTTWKSRNWDFQGAFIGYSSYVVGQVMPFLIHKNQHFNYLTKINVFWIKSLISRPTTRLELSMRALWKAQFLPFQVVWPVFKIPIFQRLEKFN